MLNLHFAVGSFGVKFDEAGSCCRLGGEDRNGPSAEEIGRLEKFVRLVRQCPCA
jgi:hypothetical protein